MLFRHNDMTGSDTDPPMDGPGRRLSRARQAWGMSREQVATTLRLAPSVVAALEEDRYEGLPPPAFVRGYLSGYARLVGLDAGELVAHCQSLGCGAPTLRSSKPPALGRRRAEALGRWLGYAALGSVLLLASGYWVASENDRPAPLPGHAAATAQPVIPELGDHLATDRLADGPLPEPDSADPGPAIVTPTSNTAGPIGSPAGGLVASASATPAAAPAPSTTLELHFDADAWVAIRDADGKRLAWETVRAGTSRTLRGATPIRVVLGDVAAIRMSVAGNPFDPSPFASGRIARFSVE